MALVDHSKNGSKSSHVLVALVENKPGVLTRVATAAAVSISRV